ncbi:MAG: hypothetical protein ACKOE6_03225 [Flammeovirgaceae bacterium]
MKKITSLAFVFALGCSESPKNETAIRSTTVTPKHNFIDSLLNQIDTGLVAIPRESEHVVRFKANSDFVKSESRDISKIEAARLGLDTSFVHEYYKTKYKNRRGTMIILSSAGTDNSGFWLVSLDSMKTAKDRYEITGGECDGGWNEEGSNLCSCEYKVATQVNDSAFFIRKIKECKSGTGVSDFVKLDRWVVYVSYSGQMHEIRKTTP